MSLNSLCNILRLWGHRVSWELRKIRGPIWGYLNKGSCLYGSIVGAPSFWKPPVTISRSASPKRHGSLTKMLTRPRHHYYKEPHVLPQRSRAILHIDGTSYSHLGVLITPPPHPSIHVIHASIQIPLSYPIMPACIYPVHPFPHTSIHLYSRPSVYPSFHPSISSHPSISFCLCSACLSVRVSGNLLFSISRRPEMSSQPDVKQPVCKILWNPT